LVARQVLALLDVVLEAPLLVLLLQLGDLQRKLLGLQAAGVRDLGGPRQAHALDVALEGFLGDRAVRLQAQAAGLGVGVEIGLLDLVALGLEVLEGLDAVSEDALVGLLRPREGLQRPLGALEGRPTLAGVGSSSIRRLAFSLAVSSAWMSVASDFWMRSARWETLFILLNKIFDFSANY